MKILVISSKNKNLFNFRGDLIKDMIAHGHEIYATGPNRDDLDDVLAVGIKRFFEIPSVRDNASVANDLLYLHHLKRTIREVKPDLVFSFNVKPVIYGCVAARLEKVPHIFAMITGLGRAYSSDGLKTAALRFIIKRLYRFALHGCEKVIFQNPDDLKQFVQEKYLPGNKAYIVNGSGVNMERFPRSDFPEKPVFLMVSRIIKEKGIIEFCEAARILRKKHPEARCILLGGFDSSIGALTLEEIQEYVNDRSVEFPGEVKDPAFFFGLSSVFVLPSYYREGLPRSVLEAMSCGRPVITTDWVGCREPIEDGINGFLVPIKDSKTLVEKMIILCDMDLACHMGEEAFRTCKEKYDVNIVNRQMREIICY